MIKNLPFKTSIKHPLILWNTRSDESFLGSSRSLFNEYLKFVEFKNGAELDHYTVEPDDLYKYFKDFDRKLIEDPNARLALENELLIAIEDNAHIHEYNLFKLLAYVVGFHKHLIEDYIYSEEEKSVELAKAADSVQKKIYYCALKAFYLLCEIKYGLNCKGGEEVQKNDIVISSDYDNILKVNEIVVEREGMVCKCEDTITKEVYRINYKNLDVLHLNLDEKMYNRTRTARVKRANRPDWSYYKNLLDEYIRNPKRKNPLEEEEKSSDRPSFEKYLRDQSKYYEWEVDALVTETLLNDNRKVKNYGTETEAGTE